MNCVAEIVVKLPALLKEDAKKIEKEVQDFIEQEKKRKLLSILIEEVMKGTKQLNEKEIVKLGREIKKGRAEKLKQLGLLS